MKILVLGAGGMIGSAMFRVLGARTDCQVMGTLRTVDPMLHFSSTQRAALFTGIDVDKSDTLVRLFENAAPEVVINCVGITKHHRESEDPLCALPLNALLPHRLDRLCALAGARLVHVSTDCVFAGTRGHYREDDIADAGDLYGRSKLLGEVVNSQHAITLRTSTIGHELNSQYGLLEWFLAQSEDCRGFARAFFSGLPTVELARVVRDIILERPDLHGLYHVGAASISKFDLLTLIAQIYGKKIRIMKDDAFVIDRSLNSQRFTAATGYQAASWPEFVAQMKVGQ